MTMRSKTTDVLDPKLHADLVGTAASLGALDTAPAPARTVAHTPEFHAPIAATPNPDVDDLFPPHAAFDDFKVKGAGDDHHGGAVIPLPDPVFTVPGLFPIEGTEGDDDLDGTSASDIINGLGGGDTIFGGDGHDNIDGGDDDDLLNGELGNDYLQGGAGDDNLVGDNGGDAEALHGNDFLYGGAGDDSLTGMGGDDWLFGGTGQDALAAMEGNDTLVGGPGGADYMYGGEGADTFVSIDDVQQHFVGDYSAAEGDTVEGSSWDYDAGTNATTVFDGGAALFVLQNYNAQVSGINLVQYDPAPPA
jgi:Ca2+-binding RTX toxin-like protein